MALRSSLVRDTDESMITGVPTSRMRSVVSNSSPVISGILTSVTMTSYGFASRDRRAARPLSTVST